MSGSPCVGTAEVACRSPAARIICRSDNVTNGMSQATTRTAAPRATRSAVSRPASGPSPGNASGTTGSAGNHSGARGSFLTTSCESVAAWSTRRARSAIRSPPIVASPFGWPPNRRAAPPASKTPTHGAVHAACVRSERLATQRTPRVPRFAFHDERLNARMNTRHVARMSAKTYVRGNAQRAGGRKAI